MKYLLDTNTWIEALNRPHGKTAQRLKSEAPDDVAMCSVVLGELLTGALKTAKPVDNLALIQALLKQFASLPFDDQAAECYGRIRADLEKRGMPIGPYDLQIAAIAVAASLIVVTSNVREFSRVSGLIVEDWK